MLAPISLNLKYKNTPHRQKAPVAPSFCAFSPNIANDIFTAKTIKSFYDPSLPKTLPQVDKDGNILITLKHNIKAFVEKILPEDKNSTSIYNFIDTDKKHILGSLRIYENYQEPWEIKTITLLKNMDSNASGCCIGTKMHQFAIEKSLENGYQGKAYLQSLPQAHIFHYKSGYRPTRNWEQGELPEKYLKNLDKWQLKKEDYVRSTPSGNFFDTSIEREGELRDCLLYNKSYYERRMGMEMREEQLAQWIERIKQFPIFYKF